MTDESKPARPRIKASVDNPSGSKDSDQTLRAEIRCEAEKIHEAAIYSSETQFEYAKTWRTVDRWVGSVAAGLAAVAGVGGLSKVLSFEWAGGIAILSALVGAISASIAARRTTEKAAVSGNSYRALQQDVRIFLRIDLDRMSEDEARATLQKLVERLQQLNRESEIPSSKAWERARKQIESGSQTYETDK
ncbi:MAG: SLATT domain-containing protein [Candidatus Dormiibacterota bacterium]